MKKLATRSLALMLVLALCLGLVAGIAASAATADDLVGTWQTSNGQRTFVLNEDGTGTYNYTGAVMNKGEKTLTWAYDGTTLTITPELGKFVSLSFDGTTLKAKPNMTNYDWAYVAYSFTKVVEETVEDVTVHAYVPAEWEAAYLYAWKADNTNAGAWPGNAMTKDGNWYTLTMPGDMENVIINNNNGTQTADLAVEAGKEIWVVVAADNSATVSYEEPEIQQPAEMTWVKVDSALTDWTGTYLIVNEELNEEVPFIDIWDGSREDLDSTSGNSNAIKANVVDGKIVGDYMANCFYIAAVEGGWSIKSASGYYVGREGAALVKNDLDQSKDVAYVNTISGIDEIGVIIKGTSGNRLGYNTNSGKGWFRYFKSTLTADATMQGAQLYKLVEAGSEEPVPEAPDAELVELLNGKYQVEFASMGMVVNKVEFVPNEGGASGVLLITMQNGNSCNLEYNYTVEGSAVIVDYGEDDPVYVTKNPTGGLNYQDGGLTKPQPLVKVEEEGEEPDNGLILGENHVEIAEYWGEVETTFTATEAGTYYFYTLDGEANAYVNINDWEFVLEESGVVSIELTAGQTITVVVASYDYNADTIDFAISTENPDQGGQDPEPQGNVLVLGDNAITVTVSNYNVNYVFYTFTAAEAGTYVLMPAATELSADIYAPNGDWIDFAELPNGYEFTLAAGESITFEIGTLHAMMGDEQVIDLVLSEKEEGAEPQGNVLVLGDNSCQITDGYDGTMYTFTATEAGTYVLSAAADENNAYISLDPWEVIDLPYTFTLDAGQSINFLVMTYDENADEINLVIAKGESEPEKTYEMILGENYITVEEAWNLGKAYTFTATEAGDYTITLIGGDLMISEYKTQGDYWDAVALPYTFTLAAGESISLKVGTTTYMPSDVAFNLAKAEAETPDPAYDAIKDVLAATEGEFTIEGEIIFVDGKNIYVQDATGGIVAYFGGGAPDCKVGDKIVVTGTRAEYNGLQELSASKDNATVTAGEPSVKPIVGGAEILINDNRYQAITLTGSFEVTEIYDNDGAWANPNITVKLPDGSTIQIYKAPAIEGLEVGDIITEINGVLSNYKTNLQLRCDDAADITVAADEGGDVPPTGDNTFLFAVVALVATMGMGLTVVATKKFN